MASVPVTSGAMSRDPNPVSLHSEQQNHPGEANEIPHMTHEASESGAPGDFVAIEIQSLPKGAFAGAKSLEGEAGQDDDDQEICRVCHLSLRNPQSESSAGEEAIGIGCNKGMEAIELGCECKDDLASAHRRCAETWFKIKGNRTCEICGKQAQNVGGSGFDAAEDEASCGQRSDDQSEFGYNGEQQDEQVRRFWHHRPICNFVLAFIVVILLLPWLFRIRLF